MPEYIGEPLANDPNHTFTKEEFKVTVIFSDSSTREVTDYKDPADHETIPETLPSAETDLSTVSAEEEPAA